MWLQAIEMQRVISRTGSLSRRTTKTASMKRYRHLYIFGLPFGRAYLLSHAVSAIADTRV
jgi:hypothetical protein